jgi:hypothetical protein
MIRAFEKLNHWRARNDAVAADLAACLDRINIKITRHKNWLASMADTLDAQGYTELAKEVRATAAMLLEGE